MTAGPTEGSLLGRRYLEHERAVIGIGSVLVFFLTWEAVTRSRLVDPLFLSAPTSIARAAYELFAEGTIWKDLRVSGTEFIGASAERYQVVVHVDAPALADPDQPGQSVLEDGTHVSAETSRRLACDASRVVMQHGRDGRVVEVAARTRTIPPALRRALQHRDRGCRFPGCGVRFGQGHHIRH